VYVSSFILTVTPDPPFTGFAFAWIIGGFVTRVIGYGLPLGLLYSK
jgi:hypothetical protein